MTSISIRSCAINGGPNRTGCGTVGLYGQSWDRYKIVVREDGDYMFPPTVDAAQALIVAARQKAAKDSSTTAPKENSDQGPRETLKEYTEKLAQEMVDNLNKYAGQHERER